MASKVPKEVALLNQAFQPGGVMDKSIVHGRDTPRHLAFSCNLFEDKGKVFLSRRALGK